MKKYKHLSLIFVLFLLVINAHIVSASETYTLRTGDVLEFGHGFALYPKQIDVEDNKVWLEITKDGEFFDDHVMNEGSWVIEKDYDHAEDVPTLEITCVSIFQGQIDSLVAVSTEILYLEEVIVEEPVEEYVIEEPVEEVFEPGQIAVWSDKVNSEVYFDGIYQGQTGSDWLWIYGVPVGTHFIEIKKSGYDQWANTIDISDGEREYVEAYLQQSTGSISLSSSPSNANIYLDGTYKGTTSEILYNIPVGSHTIRLTKSDYNEISKTVNVNSGETTSISETLSQQTGSISISSGVSGAKIYLDGTYKGTTPKTLNNIPTGSHSIRLTLTGSPDIYQNINVNPDETVSIYEEFDEPVEEDHIEEPVEEYVIEVVGEEPIEEISSILAIGALLLFLPLIGIIAHRKSKRTPPNEITQRTSKSTVSPKNVSAQQHKPEPKQTTQSPTKATEQENRISTKSAFSYKGATIIHKIKIENPTTEPISDIQVHLFVPEVFLLEGNKKSIPILEPGESKTVTFEIRPSGECGDCNVSGRVNYYDYSKKKRQEIDLDTKSLSIICPLLHINEISTKDWRNTVSSLVRTEETTRDISMPAETLFNMASRVIEDMNMFMLEPVVTSTPEMFNGVARFYGLGIKDLKYAAQIEVVGGAKKAKIILKAWAEKEDALTGFYHGMLDELEKRVQVKGYINENMIQNFYHYGDNIGTQIKDSIVQRSNIGTNSKKCPQCNTECDMNEKFCSECGSKLE